MSILSHLMRALQHNKNSTIRKNAALILGKIGDRKAVEALIKALNDRVISVRSNAAIALGMIGDKRAIQPLIHRLRATAWQERLNAAISLGWMAAPDAAHSLLSLLSDDHEYVRRGAAFALGQIGNPEMKDELVKLLLNGEKPSYEAAVVLAYMGDLRGYFYLQDCPPFHFSNNTGKSKTSSSPKLTGPTGLERSIDKKIFQDLKLGNLFYASGFFHEAIIEYRRTLASDRKISARIYRMVLNNLGNALCQTGDPDHAIIVYLLASRMKSRNISSSGSQADEVLANLKRAEILLDIQDLVTDRLKNWIESQEANMLEPLPEILQFFNKVTATHDQKASSHLLRQFVLGWKSFYAFQAYKGEEETCFSARVPFEFLQGQIPACLSVLLDEPTFRLIHLLLLRTSEILLEKDKEQPPQELLASFHEVFVYGYLIGLLQKIWHLSHFKFSIN